MSSEPAEFKATIDLIRSKKRVYGDDRKWLHLCLFCKPGERKYRQTPDMRRPKRLIATGWVMVDKSRMAMNLADMENRPFDDVVMGIVCLNAAYDP